MTFDKLDSAVLIKKREVYDMMNLTLTKADLIELLGYTDHQAKNIIRLTKKELASAGYTYYENPRLGRVPIEAVEHVVGFKISKN